MPGLGLWWGLVFPGLAGCSGMESCIVLLFLLAEHAMYCLCCGNAAGFRWRGGVVAAAGGCLAWGVVLRVKER